MTVSTVLSAHVVRIAGWRRMFRAVMLSAVALCAQSGDWAQVQALAPGAQVDVKRLSGGAVQGTVESASADALVVRGRADTVHIVRADVKRVRLWSKGRTKSGRIVGTAIGAGLAMFYTGFSDSRSGDDVGSGARARGVGIVGGLGYLIGWAKDRPSRITIFQAPKS